MAHDSCHAKKMKKIPDEEWVYLFGQPDRKKKQEEAARSEFLKALDEDIPDKPVEALREDRATFSAFERKIPRNMDFDFSDTLDLHLMTRDEAEVALRRFLTDCRANMARVVLVITGKGLHSDEGGVLRRFVREWLYRHGKSDVEWFGTAPRRYGGSGALILTLKK